MIERSSLAIAFWDICFQAHKVAFVSGFAGFRFL